MTDSTATASTNTNDLTVDLAYPFTAANGDTIKTITLRRATRGDWKAAQRFSREPADQETFLYARLSGLTMEDLDLMDMQDSVALDRRFQHAVGLDNSNL